MAVFADVVLANRSYVDHPTPPGAGAISPSPSVGGLLAALRPVIASWDSGNGSTWIGAAAGEHDRDWTDERGFEFIETPRGPLRHRRLYFHPATWDAHYAHVANSFLWPLLHLVNRPLPRLKAYYPAPITPSAASWEAYREVNRAFAAAAAEETRARTCWVHDYQLALVPAFLREGHFAGQVGFFLHTPFPDIAIAEEFLDDPGRACFTAIVEGMLGADQVGLQTEEDVARFLTAAGALAGATATPGGVRFQGRTVRVRAYPVGIAVDEVVEAAQGRAIAAELLADAAGLPLVVGLERADFTKGIPERLDALGRAWSRGGRFAYIGIAAPTRQGVETYDAVHQAIDEAATRAAAVAAARGMPFFQLRESIPWESVIALQSEAAVVFTSSLADGMNLVPLQAAMAQSLRPSDRRGVILAGQDAGVARVYGHFKEEGLTVIDPFDLDGMVGAFCAALAGHPGRISDRLIAAVAANDAAAWATHFLADLEAAAC